MSIKLSNGVIGNTLWIASNAYIQPVIRMDLDGKSKSDEEVLIGELEGVKLFGKKYVSTSFPKDHFKREFETGLWIEAGGKMYEVAGYHNTVQATNEQMAANENVALIDELLNEQGERLDLYFNSSLTPAKLN